MIRLLLHMLLGAITAVLVGTLAYLGWMEWSRLAPRYRLSQEVGQTVEGADERLRRAIARADRLDPGWRLQAIVQTFQRQQMPDETNSALQVERALALVPPDWDRAERDVSLGPLEPDETPRGVRLFRFIENAEPATRLLRNLAAGLREELDELEGAVTAARRLRDYPEGQSRIRLDRNPLETRLPQPQAVKTLACLLILDAARRSDDGDCDGAVESIHALINVARSIGNEPFLISQAARGARVGDDAVRVLERVLSQGEPSTDRLGELQAELLREAGFPRQAIALRGERAVMVDLCAKLDHGVLRLADIASSLNGSSSPDGYIPHHLAFRHNEALFLDRMTDDVEAARLPLWNQAPYWERLQARRDPLANGPGHDANKLFLSLSPANTLLFDLTQRVAARLYVASAAVAAERYRKSEGRWPDELEHLVPEFLDEVPADPYTGEPIRLAERDDGITLYALGKDRHDDGGRLHPGGLGVESGFDVGVRLFHPESRAMPAEGPSPAPTAATP
jgi:hypothetical protein